MGVSLSVTYTEDSSVQCKFMCSVLLICSYLGGVWGSCSPPYIVANIPLEYGMGPKHTINLF